MLYETVNTHGGDVYSSPVTLDFSANINPLGTPPAVLEAVKEALPRAWQYPDAQCRALVSGIAASENLPPEDVLCGNGASELIYSFCQAEKPRSAVLLAPTFSEYEKGLALAGYPARRYPLREENDFALTGDFLAYLKETWPEVVFLCNPNNPTGRLIPPVLLAEIVDFCEERYVRLFLDECFLDLAAGARSMARRVETCKSLFILKAFTKNYGLAGLRLGYALSADRALLKRMSECVPPWNVSSLAQAAGVAALKEGAFLEKARAIINGERQWLAGALREAGFYVCPGEANFLLFRGQAGLCEALLARRIRIRDCSAEPGLGAGWYRVAVRRREENEALMDAVRAVCGR